MMKLGNLLCAGVAALAIQYATAEDTIVLVSQPGEVIGGGATIRLSSAAGVITVAYPVTNQSRGVIVNYTDAASRWMLVFAPVAGQPLVVGNYENAQYFPIASAIRPVIQVTGNGLGCTSKGRFTVREIEYLPSGELSRLAIDFEHHCAGTSPLLTGTVRFNSTLGPIAPQPVAIAGAGFGTDPGTNVTLDGSRSYDADGQIVSYSWRQVSGAAAVLSNPDGAIARFTAPEVPVGGAVLVYELTVTDDSALIGTDRISILVRNALDPRNRLYVDAGPVTRVVEVGEYSFDENDGAFTAGPIGGLATENIAIRFDGDDLDWLAWFGAPMPASLAPGLYIGAARTAFRGPGVPGIDVSSSEGCNQTTGRFRILELAYAMDGSVTQFAADFLQRCENNGGPLYGSVRFNSAVPVQSLDVDRDGIPDALEEALGLDPVTADNDVFASSRLFAMQQYRDFFHREIDPTGLAFWMAAIDAGSITRAQMVKSLVGSDEFGVRIGTIARLYFSAFERFPDVGGLAYWSQVYSSNVPLASIAQAFAQSAEFQARYGALNERGYMTQLYQNVLGRAPDQAGLDYWTGQLESFSLSRGQVLEAFSQSPEFALGVGNEVLVTMLYIAVLQRTPDPAGFAYWVGQLDSGMSPEVAVAAFLAVPEYRGRFLR